MADITISLSGLSTEIAALIVGKVDLGSTNAEGICRILTGASVTIVDIPLDTPPAFSLSGDDYIANGVPAQGTAVASGTAAKAQVLDRDENVVCEGSATIIGANGFAQLDRSEIEINDVVTLQSMTVTGP
jgi:hypothetical protein